MFDVIAWMAHIKLSMDVNLFCYAWSIHYVPVWISKLHNLFCYAWSIHYAPVSRKDLSVKVNPSKGFSAGVPKPCCGCKLWGLWTGMLVNSLSNWLVSKLPLMSGSQGGGISPAASLTQSMSEKNSWRLISSASPGPLPRRWVGSRVRSPRRRLFEGRLRLAG